MFEYKFVDMRQKSFWSGRKMKLEDFESKVNEFAKEGWILDRIFSADIAGTLGFGGKDVFIIVFKKEV